MKIAVVQNSWKPDIEKGLHQLVDKTESILREKQPDFLLLPEFFVGPAWFQPGQADLKGVTDDTIPGTISNLFCDLAKQYHTNIIMGTVIERCNGKYYNTSTYIDNDGDIAKKVYKMHTFAGESKNCVASEQIDVIESNFGKIGIAVCSDFWVMEHMKILTLKGAKIIFIPGGTLGQNTDMMIQALKTIAYLTSTIVVYASAVGEIVGMRGDVEARMEYTGSSIIVTPEGTLVYGKSNAEDVLLAEIEDDYIDEYRKNSLCWKRLVSANQNYFHEILTDYVGKA